MLPTIENFHIFSNFGMIFFETSELPTEKILVSSNSKHDGLSIFKNITHSSEEKKNIKTLKNKAEWLLLTNWFNRTTSTTSTNVGNKKFPMRFNSHIDH